MLSVQILGRPRLLLEGQPFELPRRKSRALLYYLAAHRKPLTREHLLALFWAELDRPAAQQTLRATLHELRKALGEALIADKDALALAPGATVDARLFADGLSPPDDDRERLGATLALYRGDFLEGFALPDAPEFDDWVAAERERFHRLAVRGLAALAGQHERRGHFAEALEALERALQFDPLQEDLQRAAMRLHYLAGDRTGAIRRYESLRKLLNKEMGVPPMAETRALYDALLGDTLPAAGARQGTGEPRVAAARSQRCPPSAPPPTLPFCGRDAELQRLRALAADNAPRLALLEGEPGIGKTRLAEEFLATTRAVTIAGGAHELEHALPYQPIIEALRGLLSHPEWPALEADLRAGLLPVWRAEMARLLPELAVSATAAQRPPRAADEWRLWEGINQLLLALARRRPVIVFLDDLHWADASTLGVLGYLVRQATAAPIFFLAAARPAVPRSALTGLLQTLTREGRLARLVIARLASDDVATIARRLSPSYAHALAGWLAGTSEGNPYILSELVRHAREDGLLLADGVVNLNALSTAPLVPQTVYSLIQARLERLSDAARRVLDAGVAAGREFEFEVAARAAGLSESAALDALDELRSAGLIRPLDGLRYAFDHSLTMEVAYREIGEPRHRLLHRRVAEALESIHHDRLESIAGLLAWHFAEGNAAQRAAPYAFRAGQRAARLGAWTEARAFYEQALAAAASGERLPILMALGQGCHQAGQAARAAEAFREAAALARSQGDDAGRDAALLALALSFVPQGRFAEVVTLAQQVRDTGRPESAVGAEFLWGTALSLEGANLAEAASHLEAAQALHAQASPGDRATLAQIKFELGSLAAQQGDLPQAIALYREALAVARQAGDDDAALPHLILAHNNLDYHLHLMGDPTAGEHARAGLRLAREKGLLGLEPYLLSTLGEIALAAGDLAAAEKHFAEGLALAERLSMPERIAGLTANLGLVAQRRGETALAVHRLSTALARADDLGTQHLAAQIRLWLAPLLPPDEARACLVEARNVAEGGGRRRLLEEIGRLEAEPRLS